MSSIIGIDASAKRVAVVHLSTRGTILDSLYFETIPDDPLAYAQRFERVYDYLLVRSQKRDITGVFVEDAYMGVSRRGSVNHAKVIGNILAACSSYALSEAALPRTIMPATWRSKCGIKGRGKEPIAVWANEQWPKHKLDNQDLIDAACIAYAGGMILEEERLETLRILGAI